MCTPTCAVSHDARLVHDRTTRVHGGRGSAGSGAGPAYTHRNTSTATTTASVTRIGFYPPRHTTRTLMLQINSIAHALSASFSVSCASQPLPLPPPTPPTHVEGCHALCARVRMEARSNLKPSTWYSFTQ